MNNFSVVGERSSEFLSLFADGVKKEFVNRHYEFMDEPIDDIRLVFNYVQADKTRPFRRKAQATFVITVLEVDELLEDTSYERILKSAYPYLVRSLSNHLIYICHGKDHSNVYFITPEQGCYRLYYEKGNEEAFFQRVFQRLEPLASSRLVINNDFFDDLPESLWSGDEITHKLSFSGKKLDGLNLLPAPFPLEEFVTARDMRHIKKLYGIGGLSYGNLSSRKNEESFWMSASGVNKANLQTVGQDMLLIKGYDAEKNAMRISVPPNIETKRASVDAIEHWMIYMEHPEIGAIVHVHAWMDGIQATEINYPCGTLQLAETVAELIRQEDNPSQAVIGLKNHGLTITGHDLDDIFERIEGRIIPQVPMI